MHVPGSSVHLAHTPRDRKQGTQLLASSSVLY